MRRRRRSRPIEVEKQVTFPLETALAGIPGLEYTRSFSRNGFAQVTAVFRDDVDVYFARQQVTRAAGGGERAPPARAPRPLMGPISTGLGEIYMWTVEYEHPHGAGATVAAGSAGLATGRRVSHTRGRAPAERPSSSPAISARCRTGSSGRS